MSLRTIATKSAATLALTGAALAFSVGAAESASAAGSGLSKGHTITASAQFTVTQNNGIFADTTVSSSAKGSNTVNAGGGSTLVPIANLFSKSAQTTKAYEQFSITEIDAAGTVSVRTNQRLAFWPGEETEAAVTVTIGPDATRSFWINTVNRWGDTVWALVTVTNDV